MAEAPEPPPLDPHAPPRPNPTPATRLAPRPCELGGPRGLEATRYGDWERNGRCIDF